MPWEFNPFTGTFDKVIYPVLVPYYIGPTETFTVPANEQMLFATFIDSDGWIDVQGLLIEV